MYVSLWYWRQSLYLNDSYLCNHFDFNFIPCFYCILIAVVSISTSHIVEGILEAKLFLAMDRTFYETFQWYQNILWTFFLLPLIWVSLFHFSYSWWISAFSYQMTWADETSENCWNRRDSHIWTSSRWEVSIVAVILIEWRMLFCKNKINFYT